MSKLLLIIVFSFSFVVFGQQVPFYNHVNINPFVFNPATTAEHQEVRCFITHNQRYSNFKTLAVNDYLTVDGSLNKNHGIGLTVGHQAQGIYTQLLSNLSYSYALHFSKQSSLRFGLSAGIIDQRINTQSVQVLDLDDPFLANNTPRIAKFDASFGLSLRLKNLKIGIAVPQLNGGSFTSSTESGLNFYTRRHFMSNVQYDFFLNKRIVLKSSIYGRYIPGAPIQYDGNIQLDILKMGWLMVGYRSNYSVQANIGFVIKDNFRVGYSYEFITSSLGKYNTGANHEILLGIAFNKGKVKDIQIKEVIVKQNIEKIVTVQDSNIVKENDRLKNDNLALEEELRRLKEEQNKVVEVVKNETPKVDTTKKYTPSTIPIAKGYHFIDLELIDSPNGFYVISGVFSSKQNADIYLSKMISDFPESALVINKKNSYYYVVLKYTLQQEQAEINRKKFKQLFPGKQIWVLNYVNPNN